MTFLHSESGINTVDAEGIFDAKNYKFVHGVSSDIKHTKVSARWLIVTTCAYSMQS